MMSIDKVSRHYFPLLDDHYCVLPLFRVLPEFAWMRELLNLFLPTFHFICGWEIRFDSFLSRRELISHRFVSHRIHCVMVFVVILLRRLRVCLSSSFLPHTTDIPKKYLEDFLAELVEPRFCLSQLWDDTQTLPQVLKYVQ